MNAPQLSAPWQVKFTRRRGSIALQIGIDQVKVLAPKGTAARTIHQLLEQRRDWIEQALDQQRQRQQLPKFSRSYTDGEPWLIDGETYRLQVESIAESSQRSSQPAVERINDQLLVRISSAHDTPQQRAVLIQQWYQQQAQQRWPQQLQQWADTTGLQPSSLKIRPYKSRWGSCNSNGLITLNTLLLMAPPATQQYVIIHELCHLQHPNHSNDFWQLVEQFCPQPKQHRGWFRQHRQQLIF